MHAVEMERTMTDPCDILKLAAERRHDAAEAARSTLAMQFSPGAEVAHQRALVALAAADRDVGCVRDLIAEIEECENLVGVF